MRGIHNIMALAALALLIAPAVPAFAEPPELTGLVNEAVSSNHDIIATGLRAEAAESRVPQAAVLPDPMIMVGYENDGLDAYNYGKSNDAIWMYNVSQTFPFPGKLDIRSRMAEREASAIRIEANGLRYDVAAKVRQAYYDIYLAYKAREILEEQRKLFERVEDSALSRYASGMAPQQEVFMVQSGKFMLLERVEMYRQKQASMEAMLNAYIGRDTGTPISKPAELTRSQLPYKLDELLAMADTAPDIEAKRVMTLAADARQDMARREYFPDLTVTLGMKDRGTSMPDMWSLTVSASIPIHYKSRQRQAVREATATRNEASHEVDALVRMHHAGIREAWSMMEAADRTMSLYNDALIPKARQSFDAGLSAYASGKTELTGVVTSLTSLQDYYIAYWTQFTEREKAIARIASLTGLTLGESAPEGGSPSDAHAHTEGGQ